MRVACGGCGGLGSQVSFTVCIDSHGTVLGWGDGLCGQLVSDCRVKYVPTAVNSHSSMLAGVQVRAVSAGGSCTFGKAMSGAGQNLCSFFCKVASHAAHVIYD